MTDVVKGGATGCSLHGFWTSECAGLRKDRYGGAKIARDVLWDKLVTKVL